MCTNRPLSVTRQKKMPRYMAEWCAHQTERTLGFFIFFFGRDNLSSFFVFLPSVLRRGGMSTFFFFFFERREMKFHKTLCAHVYHQERKNQLPETLGGFHFNLSNPPVIFLFFHFPGSSNIRNFKLFLPCSILSPLSSSFSLQ